jgi:hypothetical protein
LTLDRQNVFYKRMLQKFHILGHDVFSSSREKLVTWTKWILKFVVSVFGIVGRKPELFGPEGRAISWGVGV